MESREQWDEWVVEIMDNVTGRLILQPVSDREEAFSQWQRWKGYDYDTRRVLHRTCRLTTTEWEEETQ